MDVPFLRVLAASNLPTSSTTGYHNEAMRYLAREFYTSTGKLDDEYDMNRKEYDKFFRAYDDFLGGYLFTLDMMQVRERLQYAKDTIQFLELEIPNKIIENCPWYQFLEIFRFTVLTGPRGFDVRCLILLMKGVIVSLPAEPIGPVVKDLERWFSAYHHYINIVRSTIATYEETYSIAKMKARQEEYAEYVSGYDVRRDAIVDKKRLLNRAASNCIANSFSWDEPMALDDAWELAAIITITDGG